MGGAGIERRNEREGGPSFRDHKDESRFVSRSSIDPDASDVDGDGDLVELGEVLCELGYELKEFDLGRVPGLLIFRGNGREVADANAVNDSKNSASSSVRPMRIPGRINAILGDGRDRSR